MSEHPLVCIFSLPIWMRAFSVKKKQELIDIVYVLYDTMQRLKPRSFFHHSIREILSMHLVETTPRTAVVEKG